MVIEQQKSTEIVLSKESTDFASKQSKHLNALYHFSPCHAYKQKV